MQAQTARLCKFIVEFDFDMLFFAADEWRIQHPLALLSDSDRGDYYALIEIMFYVPIFFVDYLSAYEDEPELTRWRQLLLPDFQAVQQVLENLEALDYEVSVIFPQNRFPNKERVVGTVVEVLQGEDQEYRTSAFLYLLADGKRLLSGNVARKESDVINLTTIYRKEKVRRSLDIDEDSEL